MYIPPLHDWDVYPRRGPLLAEPTTQPAEVDDKDTLPGTAEAPPGGDVTVSLTKSGEETPKDPLTSQSTSPTEVETQVVPTTTSVVNLASLLSLSDQAKEERWYVLDCNCFYVETESGSHQCYPRRHSDCLSWESGL